MDELQTTNINQIETEIILLKNQTAQNIIEIGKRLNQAKELVPHGEWGKWLEEKVEFSDRTARRFMQAANEFSNWTSLTDLPPTKIFALLDLPKEDREEFVQNNKIDEMTTRQLQQAIKEKKELEKKTEELKNQLEQEKNKKPEVIEKVVEKRIEVIPSDYYTYKNQVSEKQLQINSLIKEKDLLIKKAKLNDAEAKKYQELKTQIETLTQQKDNLSRKINASTELSGLTVEVKHYFDNKFAPIKYSRSIQEACKDEIVRQNLTEILDIFQGWIDEMNTYIKDSDFIDVEVM